MDAREMITKARIQLQKENPFFSYLVMHLQIHEKADMQHACGVDSKGNLYYNPKMMEKWELDEYKGVLCHEVMHLCFEHFLREGKRDHQIVNISQDLVVNDILSCNGFKLPKTGLIPKDHEFTLNLPLKKITLKDLDKKTFEEVYNEIWPHMKKFNKILEELLKEVFDEHMKSEGGSDGAGNDEKSTKKGKGQAQNGDNSEPSGKTTTENEGDKSGNSGDDWKKRLVEALQFAKQQGNVPAGMERLVEKLLESKMNWRELLYRYITKEIPFDYTWSYPSKRSQALGIYLPSVQRETIDIAVSVDTSGSIGQEELTEFVSEIVAIARSFNNIKMTLLVCDCEIQGVYPIENGNLERILELKMKGGGGTSHVPVFDWIKDNQPNARFLIALTDGFTEFPKGETLRTIWVLSKNHTEKKNIPFGEVVEL